MEVTQRLNPTIITADDWVVLQSHHIHCTQLVPSNNVTHFTKFKDRKLSELRAHVLGFKPGALECSPRVISTKNSCTCRCPQWNELINSFFLPKNAD